MNSIVDYIRQHFLPAAAEEEEEKDEETIEELLLDDEWIQSFKKHDTMYQDFYKEDVRYVTIRVLYANRENEIERMKCESFLFSMPNLITRAEVLELLKKYAIDGNKRYTLLSLLCYNITLEVEQVNEYLLAKEDTSAAKYLKVMKNIDSIPFEKTISMFQDLNELMIVLYETEGQIVPRPRSNNNSTKRIHLHSSLNKKRFKKTLRKEYREDFTTLLYNNPENQRDSS